MTNSKIAAGYLEDAGFLLEEAEENLSKKRCHRVVRLSQESTELALKSLFMFCGIDFPKEHALGKAIDRLPFTEDELGVKEKREIRKINQRLAKKRVVSFYGAEDGTPAIDIFTEEEAREAISGAKFILETVKRLEVTK